MCTFLLKILNIDKTYEKIKNKYRTHVWLTFESLILAA